MNIARFILCLSFFGGLLFFYVLPTFADTLTLPQEYNHPGLTFTASLTFSSPTTIAKPRTLEFGTIDEINVQPTTKQQVAVETIVTPTPSPSLDDIHPGYTTGTIFPSLTPTPTEITPTPSVIPTATPTPASRVITSPSSPGGLNADTLFSMINSYRATKGLPAFQKDDKTCSLAASRAPEIGEEIANGHMHSGLRDRNLPYWDTENIIAMRNETEAFNWWINDEIHKEAIESNNTYSCVACSGNSCAEEFTNYQPK